MFPYSTKDLATLAGVRPASVRRAVCVNGHYLGIVPRKVANGRLHFPADQVGVIFTKRSPEIGLQTISALGHKVAYCESRGADHRAVKVAYWEALGAVIGAGQALGVVNIRADFGHICNLLGAEVRK